MTHSVSPLSTKCPYDVTLRKATDEERDRYRRPSLAGRILNKALNLLPTTVGRKVMTTVQFITSKIFHKQIDLVSFDKALVAYEGTHPFIPYIPGAGYYSKHSDVSKVFYSIPRRGESGLFTTSPTYARVVRIFAEIFGIDAKELFFNDYKYGIMTALEEDHRRFRKALVPLLNGMDILKIRKDMTELAEKMCQQWHAVSQSEGSCAIQKSTITYSSTVISKLILQYSGSTEELSDHMEALHQYIYDNQDHFPFEATKAEAIKAAVDEVLGEKHVLKILNNQMSLFELFTKEGLELKQMQLMILFLFFGGQETSASLLQTTIYYLSQNPALQDSIYQDIQAKKETNELDLLNLESLKNVILEGLRISPPVFTVPRVVSQDAVLEIKTRDALEQRAQVVFQKFLPFGTSIHHCPFLMARDPNYFENPEEFHPERHQGQYKMHWMPFGDGEDYNCPGQHLAKLEVKAFLLELISNYTFTSTQNGKMPTKTMLTLKPGIDVTIQLKKR